MTISETRYEIMECEDLAVSMVVCPWSLREGGFNPSGESEWTLAKAEARLQELREALPEVYRNAFICQVVTTRVTARNPEVNHELQTIPTAS